MTTANKISDWLGRHCLSESGFGENPGGVTLKFSAAGGKQETVRDYQIEERTDIQQMAQAIYLDATDEAEGNGPGTHKFTLYAFKQGQKDHFARRGFLIAVENTFEEPVEEATAKGLLGQIQRHYEVQQRIQASMFPTVMHAMTRALDVMQERSHHLESTHMETLTLLKEMTLDKGTLKQEMFMTAKAENRKDMAIAKIGELLPAVVMHLLPPEVLQDMGGAPPNGVPKNNGTGPPPNGNGTAPESSKKADK